MNEEAYISGKKLFTILLGLFLCAFFGAVLVLFGFDAGRWIVYVSVPLGALGAMGGALLAMFGMIEKDF